MSKPPPASAVVQPLVLPRPLKHKYFALRHGHSIPNEQGLIVSTMANGLKPEFGLTDRGRQQAQEAGHSITIAVPVIAERYPARKIIFLVSPFSRAQDTANLAAQFVRERLGSSVSVEIRTIRALRERDFGEQLELQPDKRYAEVWAEDNLNKSSSSFGAESVAQVWNRVARVVYSTEQAEQAPSLVFLVSHGDTLQITQAGFADIPLHTHRSLKHLNQAEWRELLSPGTAPVLRSKL